MSSLFSTKSTQIHADVGKKNICFIIHDCCIRVTVVLEYISSQPRGEQLARPIRSEVMLFTVKKIARLLRGAVSILFRY